MPANTGDQVIFLGNAGTNPSASPSSAGLIMYADGGALVTRDSADKMSLGSTATDMVFSSAGSSYAYQWNVGGTLRLSYHSAVAGGLVFESAFDNISINNSPGAQCLHMAAAGGGANIGLIPGSVSPAFNSAQGIIYVGNRTTLPIANPVGGGYLYVDSGALKYRGSGGTITTLGAA